MKSIAIIISNEEMHNKLMNFFIEHPKVCCNSQRPDDVKYDPDFNFVIDNGASFQFWSDPKTIKKAGYSPISLDEYIATYNEVRN